MSVSTLSPPRLGKERVRSVSRVRRILEVLPQGRTLPPEVWRLRHHVIVGLLWAHVVGIAVYGLIRGFSGLHIAIETGVVALAALVAGTERLGRQTRTLVASLGLLSSSGILVHLSGGLIEMHFHFFVMVTVVALYQDWVPFLTSIAYVLVHHGLVGVLDPSSVYNHPAAWANPWTWAGIHSLFIAGISAVCLTTWRLNESALAHRNHAEAELRFQKTLLEFQNEATLDGVLVVSPAGEVLSHNQRFFEIWGLDHKPGDDAFGIFRQMSSHVISSDGSITGMRDLLSEPDEARRDEVALKDGRVLDVWTVPLGSGKGYGRAWYFRDITRRRTHEEELRRNKERFEFLAEASALLGSSLDYERALADLAKLMVPRMADWCVIDLIEGSGTLHRIAAEHADDTRSAAARELGHRYLNRTGAERGVWEAVDTGVPQFFPLIDDATIESVAVDDQHRDLLYKIGMGSALIAPLQARGRVLGAITFAKTETGRTFDPADRSMLEEVARRAGVAIDNARLYQDRSRVAATLQRSLLPPLLPEIKGAQLAARYLAAGEGIEVGGDFYDVFATGSDEWAVVIGDVCGKGADAAALTGLARYTLRAAAMQARKPSTVLGTLNEALLNHELNDRFCTLSYVRLKPEEEGMRLTVCAAGHPLPIVLSASGETFRVGEPGTLLGQFVDPVLVDSTVTLSEGDLFVMFTDGVIEARGSGGELTDEGLEQLLRQSETRDAESIAEAIAAKALEVQQGQPHDDIAVLVIKVTGATTASGGGRATSDVGLKKPSAAISFDLVPHESAPSEARTLLRERLGSLEPEVRGDLELLVTELVTNAVRHAGLTSEDRLGVSVSMDTGSVMVEVCNPGDGFSHLIPESPHPLQESGRGLWLVKMLSKAWGVKPEMPSCVWFELARAEEPTTSP